MARNDNERFGVHEMVGGLQNSLKQYIEAQYHIKDDGIVRERNALLQEPAVIAQRPYIEATPVYLAADGYRNIVMPQLAQDVLTEICSLDNVGLYPTPYQHQVDALEGFLGSDKLDLIVATGTGSGKTESFLMPIIATLASESRNHNVSRNLPGCRAILLYPMNALVNDQVARIRRLLGNETVNAIVAKGRNRPVRFGSYTGRTAYPGKRSSAKDAQNIAPLFEEFYNPVQENAQSAVLKLQLEKLGRWPSKGLKGFYNGQAASTTTVKSGKRQGKTNNVANWKYRLLTQAGDRELMTRHEMQLECPDLLVTNYSMLEYMLMRPIESPLFEQTTNWLNSDARNELILVLDEAHMYRGAGGAEVALLIRRLIARLGISRDRVRCILTSASLGTGDQAELDIVEFANDLTGVSLKCKRSFKVVKGTKEPRAAGRPATASELAALAATDFEVIADHVLNPSGAADEILKLAGALCWQKSDGGYITDYLFERLTGFGPAELLLEKVSGNATVLDELEAIIFPTGSTVKEKHKALDALLILCSAARRHSDGRIFVPTRLHIFHRGLPGLYACINPLCSAKLVPTDGPSLLGRFHTKSSLACNCKDASRVYEFYTHRDCGAAFVRGWVDYDLNFVWHEPEILMRQDQPRKLFPIDMMVEAESHPTMRGREAWLHLQTGRLLRARPADLVGFRAVWVPDKDVTVVGDMTFDNCPVCRKKTRQTPSDPSKIMDHVTKGEAPFSALVRAQMAHQPPIKPPTRQSPNSGRKVLIFSDGRQKAARLARDMPRDMELDLFRQVVAMASVLLRGVENKETKPTDSVLYLAFLAVLYKNNLSMFDIDSATIDAHVSKYEMDCDGDLELAFASDHDAGTSPNRYKIALLKLLCSNYYSLEGTTVGFVEPTRLGVTKIKNKLKASGVEIEEADLRALSSSWIQGLLDTFSFDSDIKPYLREKAAGYNRTDWSSRGQFEKAFREALNKRFTLSEKQIVDIEGAFQSTLATGDSGYYLNPNMVKLSIDLVKNWVQCQECTALTPLAYRASCTCCGSDKIKSLAPGEDHYLKARKSFWREPVVEALADDAILTNLYVEEHAAQLSNRDRKTVHSTTEVHELRFQDVLLNAKDRPIDVLSCTTTMEVGIDIGSLVAVALRNVPPQRENYQQRAGRAGRRGSSVSSVLTFSQNGPHDSYYFAHPKDMVSGQPRGPELKINNPKIAKRHVHSYLIQTYFQENMRANGIASSGSAVLQKSLGETRRFFHGTGSTSPNLAGFKAWVIENVLTPPFPIREVISSWIPENLDIAPMFIEDWIFDVTSKFIGALDNFKKKVPKIIEAALEVDEDDDDDPPPDFDQEDFLEFLFFHALLPSYAFPTSLCSFLVQKWTKNSKDRMEIRTEQMPQQSSNQALSEYAPGRLIVINKKTYRSGGVFASTLAGVQNKAQKLFEEGKVLVMCEACSFLQDPYADKVAISQCPVCQGPLKSELMIQPEVFGPENAKSLDEDDREQEYTFASMAQFPQPTNGETFEFKPAGPNLRVAYAVDKRLLTLNKGGKGDDLGFDVCKSCGHAGVHDHQNPKQGRHRRPYLATGPAECNGEFNTVFLGYSFTTDLLLLRLQITAPLVTDLTSIEVVHTLESASHSMAEALRLAASRHQQLDLDATEFGAGYRLLAGTAKGTVGLDVYLYDTLAGGAGYSELVAKYFEDIVDDTLRLLEGCTCDSSCTECLDHFHNQHLKRLLDRRLAASLLRYGLYGTIPQPAPASTQVEQLGSLNAWLTLDGTQCETLKGQPVDGSVLLISGPNGKLALSTFPALLAGDSILPSAPHGVAAYAINESHLSRNLPGVHAEIKRQLSIAAS